MILLHILIKVLCLFLFVLLSTFTFMFGKHKSDIKIMYVITSLFLLGVILFL